VAGGALEFHCQPACVPVGRLLNRATGLPAGVPVRKLPMSWSRSSHRLPSPWPWRACTGSIGPAAPSDYASLSLSSVRISSPPGPVAACHPRRQDRRRRRRHGTGHLPHLIFWSCRRESRKQFLRSLNSFSLGGDVGDGTLAPLLLIPTWRRKATGEAARLLPIPTMARWRCLSSGGLPDLVLLRCRH
jgi:hypothetical protein